MDLQNAKLYGNNDMVKVDCHDCKGCSSCCRDMGESIWIDPMDAYHMTSFLHKSFTELLEKEVELHVEDGLIMPNIRMVGERETKCSFLNEEGRCTIHEARPGFCRLFPLGRSYEQGDIRYFLLDGACPAPTKSKIKVSKWLNVPRIKAYESFLVSWHGLTKGLRSFYEANSDDDAVMKAINMQFLQIFYLTPYDEGDFYSQFDARMEKWKVFSESLGIR